MTELNFEVQALGTWHLAFLPAMLNECYRVSVCHDTTTQQTNQRFCFTRRSKRNVVCPCHTCRKIVEKNRWLRPHCKCASGCFVHRRRTENGGIIQPTTGSPIYNIWKHLDIIVHSEASRHHGTLLPTRSL